LNSNRILFKWKKLVKLIKNHCNECDEQIKKQGLEVPPEGHFRRMFTKTVQGDFE
jgi:hypothetical protein